MSPCKLSQELPRKWPTMSQYKRFPKTSIKMSQLSKQTQNDFWNHLYTGDIYSIWNSWDTQLCEIYLRRLLAPNRLIKSNHAETFHSSFPPWWPENLKVLLFLNASLFLHVRGAVSRDYSDITICNHLLAHQPSRYNSCHSLSESFKPSCSLRGTTRPALFPRMSPDRENCLLLFISNLIFVPEQPSWHNSCDWQPGKKGKGVEETARQGPRVI